MDALVQRVGKLEQETRQLIADNHLLRCRLAAVELLIPALEDSKNRGDVTMSSGKVVGPVSQDQKLAWIPVDAAAVAPKSFQGCGQLGQIIFPRSGMLTVIESEAFRGCKGLVSVQIPSSVTRIDTRAFCGSGLTSVEFLSGSRLESIGQEAFASTELEAILIPASVQRIEWAGVYNCQKLTQVVFEAGSALRDLGEYAFGGSNVGSFTLPPLVTTISAGLLWGCKSLTVVKLSNNGLVSIGNWAFNVCASLRCICPAEDADSLANGRLQLAETALQSIGDHAFSGCATLKEAAFPPSLATVGTKAFSGCAELTRVIFAGAGVQQMASDAFEGCPALKEVRLPGSMPLVQGEAAQTQV